MATVEDAIEAIVRDAGEPLHWTVIQDRALRTGAIDPFETPNVRGVVLHALHDLVADGRLVVTAKGVYGPAYGR
jgi:hypothetical protein